MSQSKAPTSPEAHSEALGVTLLELVTALDALTQSEEQTVALANELILSGSVRLTGNFRNQPWRPL